MLKLRLFYAFTVCMVLFWLVAFKLEWMELRYPQSIFNINSSDIFNAKVENPGDPEIAKPCPTGPVVAIFHNGYMKKGNFIWAYASTWALAKVLERPAFASKEIIDKLKNIFANLSIPAIEDYSHCDFGNFTKLNASLIRTILKAPKEAFEGENLLTPPFNIMPELLLPYLDEIREKELKFNSKNLYKMKETIRLAGGDARVIVAVHARRKDNDLHLWGTFRALPAHHTYYLDAMEWFRTFLGKEKPLFLIVSDDSAWCRKNNLDQSDDAMIVSKGEGHDLALLSLADHNILDYGAFGMWAGLVTKGHTITLMDMHYNGILAKYKDWHVFEESKYMRRVQFFE